MTVRREGGGGSDAAPLTAPGPLRSLDIKLEPGKYRLVTPPIDVDARMVARLMAITPDVTLEGHGPHKLGYDDEHKLQWREPASKDLARAPDVWTFARTLGSRDPNWQLVATEAGQ